MAAAAALAQLWTERPNHVAEAKDAGSLKSHGRTVHSGWPADPAHLLAGAGGARPGGHLRPGAGALGVAELGAAAAQGPR